MKVWDADAARVAKVRGRPLEEAVANWDRSQYTAAREEARRLRQHVLDLFPIESYIGTKLVNAAEQALNTDALNDPQQLLDALVAEFQPAKDLLEADLAALSEDGQSPT